MKHSCITQRRVLRRHYSRLLYEVERQRNVGSSVSQSGEQKNMRRVGHTDLQGRPAYQPNVIQYPNGRYIAIRRHAQQYSSTQCLALHFLPNPLNEKMYYEPKLTMVN